MRSLKVGQMCTKMAFRSIAKALQFPRFQNSKNGVIACFLGIWLLAIFVWSIF
jgi:hypothetical protein